MNGKKENMLKWEDKTDTFSEAARHWKGRYLEKCEVALEEIECDLYSCPDDDWEIYVNYGIMHGISYVPVEKAIQQRDQMKKEIEEEYEKHQLEPSDDFINAFAEKYRLDFMNAIFRMDDDWLVKLSSIWK